MDHFKAVTYAGPHGISVKGSKLVITNYYGSGDDALEVSVSIDMIQAVFGTASVRNFLKYCRTKNPLEIPKGAWCSALANDFADLSPDQVIGYLVAVTGVAYTLVRDDVPKPTDKEILKLVKYDALCARVQTLMKGLSGDGLKFVLWFLNGLKKFNFLTAPSYRRKTTTVSARRVVHGDDLGITILWLIVIIAVLLAAWYLARRSADVLLK